MGWWRNCWQIGESALVEESVNSRETPRGGTRPTKTDGRLQAAFSFVFESAR
jgi:hypothetical protein